METILSDRGAGIGQCLEYYITIAKIDDNLLATGTLKFPASVDISIHDGLWLSRLIPACAGVALIREIVGANSDDHVSVDFDVVNYFWYRSKDGTQEIGTPPESWLPNAEHAVQLARWELAGKKLWPFVRVFPLCGAHPTAIEAVEELAGLLGQDGSAGEAAAHTETARKSRAQTIDEIATWFESNPRFWKAIGSKRTEAFSREIRQMASAGRA